MLFFFFLLHVAAVLSSPTLHLGRRASPLNQTIKAPLPGESGNGLENVISEGYQYFLSYYPTGKLVRIDAQTNSGNDTDDSRYLNDVSLYFRVDNTTLVFTNTKGAYRAWGTYQKVTGTIAGPGFDLSSSRITVSTLFTIALAEKLPPKGQRYIVDTSIGTNCGFTTGNLARFVISNSGSWFCYNEVTSNFVGFDPAQYASGTNGK